MQKSKAGATLPVATKTRKTLKRQEYFRLGKLIQDAAEISGGTVIYKPGYSDETVSASASAVLGSDIPMAIVAKTRQALFGNIPGESGGTKQKLDAMVKQIASMNQAISAIARRIEQIECSLTAPAPVRPAATPAGAPREQPAHTYPTRMNGTNRHS